MNLHRPAFLPRRKVLAAGLGALVLAVPQANQASARAILQRGMSGGGLAQIEGETAPGLANFGLFASSMQLPEGRTIVLGLIQWIEAGAGLQLESIEVTQCIPSTEQLDGAEVRGRMKVNGAGDYPFVLTAIDAGRPGSGLDRIVIEVNTPGAREGATTAASDDDFTYDVAATVVAGDFQWIIVDVELDN